MSDAPRSPLSPWLRAAVLVAVGLALPAPALLGWVRLLRYGESSPSQQKRPAPPPAAVTRFDTARFEAVRPTRRDEPTWREPLQAKQARPLLERIARRLGLKLDPYSAKGVARELARPVDLPARDRTV